MTAGLERRYDVQRLNDPDGKHDDCRYFVLDPRHDWRARVALRTYADLCKMAGPPELARDLYAFINEVEARPETEVSNRPDPAKTPQPNRPKPPELCPHCRFPLPSHRANCPALAGR